MALTREELRTVHPPRYWGFKCGQWVTFKEQNCLFLGYKDKEEAVIAIGFTGEKIVVYLNELGTSDWGLIYYEYKDVTH